MHRENQRILALSKSANYLLHNYKAIKKLVQ